MNNVTRILIVEDTPTDYELAQREIRRVVKRCEFERAAKQKELLKALDDFQPDLILSDYSLPGFDGLKVLKLAQQHNPAVPVIIWTGSMGENVAVECLKRGASNYILKHEAKRLGPAVTRALEERHLILENKKAEGKLLESEENYRFLFENNPLPMWIYDLETLAFLKVNEAAIEHYGYSREEFMGMTIREIRPAEDVPALLQNIARVTQGIDHAGTWRHCKKDGTIILVDIISHLVQFAGRQAELVVSIDITRRMEIESAEREQRTLAQALRRTAETLGSTLDYGEVLDQILITVGQVVPSDAATIMLLQEEKARVVRSRGYKERGLNTEVMETELSLAETPNLLQMFETGKPAVIPSTQSYPGWKQFPHLDWLRSNVGAPISLRGEVIGFILLDCKTPGFFTAIHAERLEAFANQAALAIHNSRLLQQAQEEIAARKQTEEALQESEERFRLITQYAEDMIWTMNMEFQLTYVSPAVERALGYTGNEILATDPKEFLTPESYEIGLKVFHEEVENARSQPDPIYARLLEMQYRRKDGSVFWVEMKFSFFRDQDGNPTAVLGVGRDINERKHAEARLNDLLEFNEKILNHSPLGILTYKLTGECVFANQFAASIVGTTVEKLLAQNFHTILSWRESGLYDLAGRAISSQSAAADDVHHKSTFGKDVWLSAHFVPFNSKEEEHILLTVSDITEQKLAEDQLRESENRLILALSAAQMSVWEWNLDTNQVLWSPEFYAVTGITESAFDGTFDGYTSLIHPQDALRVRRSAEKAVANGSVFAEEFRIIRPDGEVRWLANLGHAEYGPSDNSLRMIGTVQDITQRKNVEIERQAILEIMQGLTRTGDLQELLALIHRSIGKVIFAENCFVVFHNRDTGLFEEIYSVDQYDSPAPPSKLEKSITSYVFRSGEPLLVNQVLFEELAAKGEVELIGTDSASWLGAPIKTLNKTLGVIVVQDYENPNRYTERDKNFLASIATQVALALERRQAEEQVRESEERYRALFENSPISIWEEDFSQVKKHIDFLKTQGVTDFRSLFASHPELVTECTRMIAVLDVNHAGLQMYHAESKQALIESTLQGTCLGEQEHNHEDFIAIADGKTSNSWEGADETMTGEPLEINLKWSVAPGHEQDFSRVIVTVIDITERKRAEEEIRRQTEMRIALYETTQDLVIERDLSNLLNIIVERVTRLLNTGGGGLYLCEPQLGQVRCVVSYNTPRDFTGTILQYGEGAAGLVAQTGEPLIIDNYSSWSGRAGIYDNQNYFDAVLSAPIKWQGQVMGVIHALSYSERRFNENDLNLMMSFANQAAIAIQNAWLHNGLEQQNRIHLALQEATLPLIRQLDISEELQTITSQAAQMLNTMHGFIYLISGNDNEIELMTGMGKFTEFIGHRLKPGEGIGGKIWQSGQPLIVPDYSTWEGRSHQFDEVRFRSVIGVPLVSGSRVIGVLGLANLQTDQVYDSSDLELLNRFAQLASIALENARLYTLSQQELAERKRMAEALQAAEEKYRRLVEQLPAAIYIDKGDDYGTKTYISPQIEKISGYAAEDWISDQQLWFRLIHPEDCDRVLAENTRTNQTGEIFDMEYRLVKADGQIAWVRDEAVLIKSADSETSVWHGMLTDITDRKQTEEALRESEEELSRRAKETSALLETSLALTSLDLQSILHEIGYAAKSLFTADGCRVFLMQPDGESLHCVLALLENPTAFSHLIVKLGQGVTGAVAASGQAEIVNDMLNDPRGVQVQDTDVEAEAIMFAPLKERDRTIGVLSVRRLGNNRPFQSTDLEFLEAFASMAASAVSNARLFEETQRRLSELEALYENGLAVGQFLEPRQIGEQIIETFTQHLSWHHVAIRLLKPGTEELELIAFNQPELRPEARAETERRYAEMIDQAGKGLSGWAVQTGKPFRTGNVREHPQYVDVYPGIRSGLYMPLRIGERVIGVISVESERPDALTAQDERLLATFANQASIAFENARLYQAAQQEITERKLIEEELRESQERYRLLIETSPDGILMMNMDGMIRFNNLQMAGLFNLNTPSELLGCSIVSLFAPVERAYFEQHIGRRLLDATSQEGHWFVRKDGSRFFGELRSSALSNEKGEQYAIMAQLRDVTERKQSQEALQEERQRFLDLFENSPTPTWLEDFTAVTIWMEELRTQGVRDLGKYLEANPNEFKTGVSLIRVLNVNHAAVIVNGAQNKQELISKLYDLMLDKIPSHVMIHELDMIWQGNTSFGFEMSSPRVDGTLITGILRVYIPSNNGKPDYAQVIVTSTDITERVEIERKLRTSELHYRELADSITDVLFELDHDLCYTHWNKASEKLMGITAGEVIGKSMYEIFGRTDEQIRIGKIYMGVLEEDQAKTFETKIVIHGQEIVFEVNAYPSTRGVSVVARNITERKLSETLMQKRFELVEFSARHSFEEVLQKIIDVVSELTDSHIGFIHFVENDQSTINLKAWSTETLQKFCQAEGDGMHYPVGQAGVWAEAVRKRQPVIHDDYESLPDRKGLPDGHAKVTREMVIPIIRNEKIVAVMGVGNKLQEYAQQDIVIAERFADYAWDITERKQMESALAEERNQLAKRVEERTADLSRANSNLARALRVKDEFLANMSHELRTPLNAILGLSESLGEQVAGPLNEKQQKYLSTINESGHHLLALINDILDLAKIEAGQITLDINKVDVNSVCQASLRMIKQLAQKKHQEVLFEIDEDLGLMWADERRLKQMIVNLLSNAVKFTPELGRIGLEVRGERSANKVVITVWDTGIGIREQDLERLFRPFVQLDSGLAREATGTGLGLALVAQMARLHGGSVHAISHPGEGSRFIIQLPWEPAMAGDMASHLRNTGKFRAVDPNGTRPTILLIEDTREVVMMLVDYLEMAGYKMVTAQDGIDGLAQAKLTHPDLILMDIQMPRMDGFEATQRLRSDPEFRDIPIIALTALAMPNDRQRCLDAGMDEYMSKPVNLKTLTKTIHKLLYREVNPS